MAYKSKKSPSRKTNGRKSASKKAVAKRTSLTTKSGIGSVGKTIHGVARSAGKSASVARKAGGGLVRRAVKVLGQVAAPLMAGGSGEKLNSN